MSIFRRPNRNPDFEEQIRRNEQRYYDYIREAIKKARLEKHMTQEQLGKAIHKSGVIISHLESGRTEVNAIDLMRLAHVLEKPIKYFFPIEDVPSEEELNTEEWELVLNFRKMEHQPELRKLLLNEARKLAEFAQTKTESIATLLIEEIAKEKEKRKKKK